METNTEVFKKFDMKTSLDEHYVEILVNQVWPYDVILLLTGV